MRRPKHWNRVAVRAADRGASWQATPDPLDKSRAEDVDHIGSDLFDGRVGTEAVTPVG
jgi:hypothetical protein